MKACCGENILEVVPSPKFQNHPSAFVDVFRKFTELPQQMKESETRKLAVGPDKISTQIVITRFGLVVVRVMLPAPAGPQVTIISAGFAPATVVRSPLTDQL